MDNIEYHTTALSFGDLKNSMLYFDNLIPIGLAIDLSKELGKKKDDKFGHTLNIVKEIIPKELINNSEFADSFVELTMSGYDLLSKMAMDKFDLIIPEEQLVTFNTPYKKIAKKYGQDCFNFIDKFNLYNYPFASGGVVNFTSFLENKNVVEPAILTLSNLKMIDASNVPWEQIIEFRKDPNAKAKLRKLRLFAYANYTGKSKNYIEDDIKSKIYDYENTAKKFGFDMLQATINNVLNSKLFNSVLTGSILTTLLAKEPMGLITASVGTVIELGHLTLEFKRQHYELQNLIKDNPASFIKFYLEKLG